MKVLKFTFRLEEIIVFDAGSPLALEKGLVFYNSGLSLDYEETMNGFQICLGTKI